MEDIGVAARFVPAQHLVPAPAEIEDSLALPIAQAAVHVLAGGIDHVRELGLR
jgi:hypothetical protein